MRALSEERLGVILLRGEETSDIEFKGPGRADDKGFLAQVVKACLGLANLKEGGVVIIGVVEKPGEPAEVVGLNEDGEK